MAREFSVSSQIGLTALLVAAYLSILAIGGLRKLNLIYPLVAVIVLFRMLWEKYQRNSN
jgi:O-antigen ligase